MKKWAIVFVIALAALAASAGGGFYGLTRWYGTYSVDIMAFQRDYRESRDEYFSYHHASKPGFQFVYLNPRRFRNSMRDIILDPDIGETKLQIATELIQCWRKSDLRDLGDQIIDTFEPKEAARRLELVFLPPQHMSSYHFSPEARLIYGKWFAHIEKHLDNPDHGMHYFEGGLKGWLDDGYRRLEYPTRAGIGYPLRLCPTGMNSANPIANRDLGLHLEELVDTRLKGEK